jgi:hypothetical protein
VAFLVVAPDALASAAADLQGISSALTTANAAAAAPTTALAAAATDEISAAITALFAEFGKEYQALSLQLNAFEQQFAQALNSATALYVATDTAITTALQPVIDVINAPTELLLGRGLIGNGKNGTAASPNGGAGGLLIGNGGNGYSQTTTGVGGGAGGEAGMIGIGGAGGAGGPNAPGGAGGRGGWLLGIGGTGGPGGVGPTLVAGSVAEATGGLGGAGGRAGLFGWGGTGGPGGAAGTFNAGAGTGFAGGGGIGGNGGWLLGWGGANGLPGAGQLDGRASLYLFDGVAPTTYISVNNGPYVPVLVDTGSTGLVIPWWQIGIQNLGLPTGYGISAYSGGLIYFYLTFHVPINFGNGVVTAPTYVDVPIISFPTTLDRFFAGNGVVGILGLGANATGPGPGFTSDLPGNLNSGVLIDQPSGSMQFGPNPLAPGTTFSVSGSPITTLGVKINGGSLQQVPMIVDSGGVHGTIPASVLGTGQAAGVVPDGTLIQVYSPDGGTLLYQYTVNGNGPTVISSGLMNTGNVPFALHPIYTSYGPTTAGTTVFKL